MKIEKGAEEVVKYLLLTAEGQDLDMFPKYEFTVLLNISFSHEHRLSKEVFLALLSLSDPQDAYLGSCKIP